MKLPLDSSPAQSRQTREQFANPDVYLDYELGKAVQALPPLYTRLVGVILSAAVFSVIAWAGLSKVDEVAQTHGKLIPGEEVQPVRSPSSGKIKLVNPAKVKEGQHVQKDDVLIALDSESSLADIERLNNQAQLIRQDIQRVSKAGDESQKARIKGAEIELSGLRKQLAFSKSKANRLRRIVGAITRIEVENAQQEVRDLETKIAAKQQEIQQLKQNYHTGLLSDLSKRREELQSVERQLKQAQFQRQQQVILAPITGRIYNIRVNPSQGIVQSGEELLSILPEGKEPLLEVDLPNQYRGFVDENMNAKVKIDAFPYQEYGVIEGTVVYVSPYAVVKDKNLGKEVYPTRIKLHQVTIRTRGQDKLLTPGMEATGEFVMRQKSILSLLIEPVTRKFDEVFSIK
ncbi:HlyD family efflux transporter periplasmic adaptor subunit [Nostocaceae cyanobacterium CENA357]|uniref:HlyD family efflux transporter periplasmic adaptor subunit n=1 Tax=Atlanticothrix silvestris CENA357 TaxID=1725252 RepID=A0A8J7HMP7_9CYAN|nr:HlyD family efflux transporter periplasmic adaptor subunit [Atlanticothrix silvestris]MBH8555786.1 HlyD family efflux transporter periplasmic adaptor subunit [Atlanticothrix silvestris CENA357]